DAPPEEIDRVLLLQLLYANRGELRIARRCIPGPSHARSRAQEVRLEGRRKRAVAVPPARDGLLTAGAIERPRPEPHERDEPLTRFPEDEQQPITRLQLVEVGV